MRQGLKGNMLPESQADYDELALSGELKFKTCCLAATPHPHIGRTHTRLGWAETQISGSCEECFDELFNEPETE